MGSNAIQTVQTRENSEAPVPPRKEPVSNNASAQRAMPPENKPQALNPPQDNRRNSTAAAAQEQTSSNSSNGNHHWLKSSMREDRPPESNTGPSWVERAGRWVAGSPPSPSSPQTGRGNSRTSENEALVKNLRKFRNDDLIMGYIDQLGRANLAEEKLRKAAQEFKTTQAMMQDKIAGQSADIRRAQETVFATLASTGPKAEDDDMIRDNIWAAKKQWKPFARTWALKNLDDIRDKDEAKELFNRLWADTEFTAHDGLNAENNKTKAPYILLNAELAHFIKECIIQAPFLSAFGLGRHRDDETGDPFETTNALRSVYDLILKHNPAAAHLWRAQTVAAIDPPSHSMVPSDTARRQEAVERKEKLYSHLVTIFETSSAHLLFRDINGEELVERQTQLTAIFRAAGQVFSPLWSQRVNLQGLGPKTFLKKPFQIKNPMVEPHASHKLDPEDPKDGGTSMDNMPIQLVVEPAIVAWGNERGEDYGRYKIWSRAVVWVSSGKPMNGA